MFLVAAEVASRANWRCSIFRPVSMSAWQPSYTQARMASGAGYRPCVLASSPPPTPKNSCVGPGVCGAPPGNLKPFASQGFTAACAPSASSQSRARSSTWPAGTTSSTMPAARAAAGATLRPSSRYGSAFLMPIMRGRRCVPPAAGSKPSVTSGRPSWILGSSATMRRWQARQISRPPPSAVPLMAATKGLPDVSIARSVALTGPEAANDSCALWIPRIRSRSPPATNSGRAEATITPFTSGSPMARRTAASKAAVLAALSTFIGRSATFQVRVAMPSASVL